MTGALAVAGSALAEKIDDGDDRERQLPADAVALVPSPVWPTEHDGYVDFEPSTDQPVDASLRQSVDDIVPTATWHDRRIATWDAAPARFDDHGPVPMLWPDFQIVVADAAMMNLYELTASEREALEETGLLALQPWGFRELDPTGARSITISTESGDVSLPYAVRDHVGAEFEASMEGRNVDDEFTGVYGIDPFMITEEAARAAGFDIVVSGAFHRSESSLTESQRSAIEEVFYGGGRSLGSIYRDVPNPANPYIEGYWHWPSWTPPPLAVQASIVGAALLLTLLVVAIGLALASTESHDERDVLVAVGARPRTMRSMAGAKAVVITLTGVVLAVPAGLVPVAAVMRAVDEGFQMPWAALGLLLVAVPLVAGGAAWLVSAIAQRARPPQMSTLAFE